MNYPIKKKVSTIKLTSSSNRGMDLEEAINLTNEIYIQRDIAYIYKKPIPIQVVSVDYAKRSAAKITEAYYKVPSTTDYNGIYKGRYIDFEAKETILKTSFPLKNIHEHQVSHLGHIVKHGGIGFILVAFKSIGKVYLLEAKYVVEFYQRFLTKQDRRSISLTEFEEFGHLIPEGYALRLDYLKIIEQLYFSK
ncbi:MAG: Holliday junction resolvase RecU [Candidatus Izemoplasmatales bacterium]|jgi:recombination protein U|nr:Holliday junction resolvase RecU [bacterium]MDZ4196015.1 Holliday junction resolvase RecU [Candidatus Izemoplasmatales bacterium]